MSKRDLRRLLVDMQRDLQAMPEPLQDAAIEQIVLILGLALGDVPVQEYRQGSKVFTQVALNEKRIECSNCFGTGTVPESWARKEQQPCGHCAGRGWTWG